MSARDESPWTAGAHVYSGRPDPRWIVPSGVAEQLVALCDRLPPRDEAPAVKAMLGYRGCWLDRAGGPRLVARDGVTLKETSGARPAVHDGSERAFERALLATAPRELLPPMIPA